MGSEDLFHKRKAKRIQGLDRRKAKRSAYEKVLIVCEGEKTEPNYFKGLISHYELNTANVEIDGTCGSSPRSVMDRAEELYAAEKKKGDPYDKVFCVFDQDSHESYQETLDRIAAKTPKNTFFAAVSVPSFEYWLLLHFVYTTRPFVREGQTSPGQAVLNELKRYMPGYEKGAVNVFEELVGSLEQAKQFSIRALGEAERNGTDNPTTTVHELVALLQDLKG